MINKYLLKIINVYNDLSGETGVNIPEGFSFSLYELLGANGIQSMSESSFWALKDHYLNDDSLSSPQLAFILCLTGLNIYKDTIDQFQILNDDIGVVFNLLAQNRIYELDNIFLENSEKVFFYNESLMLNLFIEAKVISIKESCIS